MLQLSVGTSKPQVAGLLQPPLTQLLLALCHQ